MKWSTVISGLLLLCLVSEPALCLSSEDFPSLERSGGGRRIGGGRWGGSRGRGVSDEVAEDYSTEELAEGGDTAGGSVTEGESTNSGYTINKLYGERNDPPMPNYPRTSPSGEVDTKSMYRIDGVPKAPQRIRLRSNRTDSNANEGRVEVEHKGSWGLVCDGYFGNTEANVACKSLGFKQGANNHYSNSFFGTGQFRAQDILLGQVRCSPHAEEADLNQCTHSHTTTCALKNTAGVECKYNEGCEWGWIGYDGLCYRLGAARKTPDEAASECGSANASLAYVLSEGENNFISNLMYTKYKNVSAVWTAGQFASVEKRSRTKETWVFKDSDHVIKQDRTYWFPGFSDGSGSRPTVNEKKRSCLALSKIFFRRDTGKDTEVNYFWWDNISCKTKLPYICQKLATSTDCYNGTGQNYMGQATRTEDGSLCEKWGDENPDVRSLSSATRSYGGRSGSSRPLLGRDGRGRRRPVAFGSGGSGGRSLGRRRYGYGGWDSNDHNYCRNPDGDEKPWCWIDRKQRTMGYCNIRQCGNSTKPNVGPPKHLNASFNSSMCQRGDQFFCPSMIHYRPVCVGKNDVCDGYNDCVGGEDEDATFCRSYKCKKDEFYCSKIHTCLPTSRVCDKHYDCDYGDDETPEACKKYRPEDNSEAEVLKQYVKRATSVDSSSLPDTLATLTYYTLTLSQCKAKCNSPVNNFVCAGFMHSPEGPYGTQCILLGDRLTDPLIEETAQFTYYEKLQTCDPTTQFVCKSGLCITAAKKCNGFDDCGDFSDEIGPSGCPDPKPTFEVRLSSGKGPYEGRIEVKLFKEWGLVCDDGLDASLGDLVCKQLGYPLGHEKLSPNARREFGRGSGKFLMSSANCAGVTTSLYDCPHAGWRVGNCSVNNVAGLVCRRQRACESKEFRCSDRCVPLSAVCNNVKDCPDVADEPTSCASMTLALKNGNTTSSGVLTITRGGIPGAICDDGFGDREVQVACRQLGFTTGRGRILNPGPFQAPENLVVWAQDVKCRRGTEASLFDCSIGSWGNALCDVSEAVQIECGITAAPPPATAVPITAAPRPPSESLTPAPPSGTGTCGQRFGRFPAGRIVNGYPAIVGQFPWQVGIRIKLSSTESQQWCGGTIISDRWIVTASHCFMDYPKNSYILRIGDVDNTVKEPLEREFEIDLIVKHQKYSGSPEFDYDITLLKVKPDRQGFITFNDAVQPACLPEKTLVAPKSTVCHISGWGSVGTMDLPKNLMAANVPLIENAKCNEMYANRISERMQCAGFEAGGIDSCQGDSGGPLVCKIDDRYVLLGATSWGEGCALPGAPGVYANVRNLRDWIDQTIRSNP